MRGIHSIFPAVSCTLLALLYNASAWALDGTADQTAAPFTSGGDSVSLAAALMKAIGALILVLGLMLLLVKLFRKLGTTYGGLGQGAMINILETRMLAPKKQVAVIEVGGECLVIGITDQQINLLSRLTEPDRLLRPTTKPATGSGRVIQDSGFAALLERAKRPGKKPSQENSQV